jgi:GT2 family glycosyltransferase
MRIKRAGWEIWCVPQAHIIHHEARSTRQFRDKMYVELWKARFILFRKNYSKSFNKIARALIRRGMSRAIREIGDRAARGLVTQEDAGRQVTAYERVRELSYQ